MGLNSGNHECRQLTRNHNFWSDCIIKYDQEIYDILMECFDKLPICAIINGKFLAVHGGLSPDVADVAAFDFLTQGQRNQPRQPIHGGPGNRESLRLSLVGPHRESLRPNGQLLRVQRLPRMRLLLRIEQYETLPGNQQVAHGHQVDSPGHTRSSLRASAGSPGATAHFHW